MSETPHALFFGGGKTRSLLKTTLHAESHNNSTDKLPLTLKIGIIWADPYSNNLGVAALAYSTLAILNDVCNENNIIPDFKMIGSRGKKKDSIFINNSEIKISNIIGNDHLKWKSLLRLALFPKKYNTTDILSLDIVFDISEGDSFTDIYGIKRHKKFINSKIFFNFWRIPQILLPQTIGPFISKQHERQAFRVMKKMDLVISRDKQSLEYTSKFLPKNKIHEAIDVAFYMPFQKNVFPDGRIHVGVNISGLLWNGGYTKNNQFNTKSTYSILIEKAVQEFINRENVTLHLISHVINKRRSVEDDYSISEEFNRKYPETTLAPPFYSPIQAKNYISGLDFFFGSRMHACIAAFSSGVPVFPLAYSRKFNGLFGETLTYKWFGDCINENEELILHKLNGAFEDRHLLKKEIDYLNSNIVSSRLENLKDELLKKIRNVKFNSKKN